MKIGASAAAIERAEAETYADFEAAAPAAARAVLGTAQLHIGGGVALAMLGDPSGFWSRTLGLGFAEPVTADLMARVVEFYQEHDVTAASMQFLATRSK
jgi:hypothetical protein